MSGKKVFLMFFAFFATIVAVNSGFLYMALHTNTGLVTEQAYEKGLAYNQTLDAAKGQPDLKEVSSYENGVFTWSIKDHAGVPLSGANVVVHFIRPVQDGYDFSMSLKEDGAGQYSGRTDFPVKGLWQAKLSAEWKQAEYRTMHKFIAK